MESELMMAHGERSVAQFLAELAAPRPVPGGGSAAALTGALAAALVAMVAGLKAGRSNLTTDQRAAMRELASSADTWRARLLALVDEDAAAYAAVRGAAELPRSTETEQAHRSVRLRQALRLAIEPPLATAHACSALLPLAALAAEQVARSAASDAYAAAVLAHAALLASEQNVRANLAGLQDQALAEQLDWQLAAMKKTADEALERARQASRVGR